MPNPGVLDTILLSEPVIHKLVSTDLAEHVVFFFHKDNLELLAHRLRDLRESKCHRFVLVRCNVLIELLINLLADPLTPGFDLLINELHFAIYSFNFFLLSFSLNDV